MSRSESAVSKVEEYMRAESRLSSVDKPQPYENEPKAAYCWRLIRQSVRLAVDVTKKAEARDLQVVHGVQHSRKLNHTRPIQEMLVNKKTKDFVTFDGDMLRVFRSDGRRKDIITPPEPFKRLVYASQVNLYVGWSPGEDKVYLMNEDFEMQSTSTAEGPIQAMIYNENIGEVLTIGKGFITNWVFRYGGRHILPRKTNRDGFTEDDKFDLVILEETASRSQKLFCASGTEVSVFNVFEGKLLSRRSELHVRTITALLHFNPLKYLITGAKDGSIKVWDEKWHVQLVFVGHGGPITSLAVFPHGPNIMSSSLDTTLRVWSLETCDQVDEIQVNQPVMRISTQQNENSFFSYNYTQADLWTVRHVHSLHTRISHRVQQIKVTDHPEYPIRNILLCKDSSVRIMSPASGEVLTTLMQPPNRRLTDAAYAIADDLLYAVYEDGTIVKCATCTNPATVLDEWPCADPKKACNYIMVYEYVITAELGGDIWGGMKRAIAVGGIGTPSSGGRNNKTSANRTLLLGGRKDGHICVFNRDTGEIEFEIEAHGTKGVLSMIANSKADQLISAGLDNIIKIWRLYPYAQESLAPLMSFFCAHTPVYMSVLKTKLAVAFQEPTSATYSVVMYNLHTKNRQDHGPEDDHMDSMTGLSACNRMKLLASSSMDGTVRIWNEANVLVRVMQLNAVPHSMTFCSDKGDILVGIGEHVHMIDYKNYMPRDYRFKMVSMQFMPQIKEKALPFDDGLLADMSRDDVKRLKAARSSFKFTHFVDILTDEENEEVMREKRLREKAFAELEARDNVLNKIRDGEMVDVRKPKSTPLTKRDAFDKYLRIFYNRTFITLPDDTNFPEDDLKKLMEGEPPKVEEKYIAEKEPTGFFPAPSSAKPLPSVPSSAVPRPTSPSTTEPKQDSPSAAEPEPDPLSSENTAESALPTPSSGIRPGGFIPNSVLVRLLWPPDVLEQEAARKQQLEESVYRPPQLTAAQLSQIGGLEKKSKSVWSDEKKPKLRVLIKSMSKLKTLGTKDFEGTFRDRTMVMDYDEETTPSKPPADTEEKSSFMKHMEDMMKKPPSPPPSAEPEPRRVGTESPARSITPSRIEESAKKVTFKPKPPPTKLPTRVAPPLVKREPFERSRAPPPPERERTPSPPPTPLPTFITQFQGTEWFDKYFPKCNENTMPKPWSSQAFAVMLARVLRIAEYPEKPDIVASILAVQRDAPIKDPEPVTSVIYGLFNHYANPPTCADPHQKAFILKALELLHALRAYDRTFYRELMVQFLEGDKDVRNLVQDILNNIGLQDPHNYLIKELDGWDLWNLPDSNRPKEIRRICDDFLNKWMTSFKIHVADSIERLKKGENLHGRATPTQLTRSQHRNVQKKNQVETIGEDEELQTTVTFEKPPDPSSLEDATYIEALNYFCEMELEKNLDRIRGGGAPPGGKDGAVKNTVLVLPKIAGKASLVRLGETHTSKCRPNRETAFAADLHLPPITARGNQPAPGEIYGFPPCINLPMKSVIMNPFGSLDEYDEKPVMLMLRTAQKYFVHTRSYVEPTATS